MKNSLLIIIVIGVTATITGVAHTNIPKPTDVTTPIAVDNQKTVLPTTTPQTTPEEKVSISPELISEAPEQKPVKQPPPQKTQPEINTEKIVNIPVPHIWEIPDGVWVNPWANACEESSIVMIEQFYLGRGNMIIPRPETKTLLQPLFNWQDKVFGSNSDSDSKRTARIINEYSSFEATIKEYPTLEEIKAELDKGFPVITFHYAKGMNPDHVFSVNGSYYHVIVVTGYNDETEEFYVNDSEFKDALDYPYSYDTIMDTLHDFDHTRRKADGPPVAIFTRPKQLVQAEGSNAVYRVKDGVKHYISHPRVFTNNRWSWDAVKTVDAGWLNSLPNGPVISE